MSNSITNTSKQFHIVWWYSDNTHKQRSLVLLSRVCCHLVHTISLFCLHSRIHKQLRTSFVVHNNTNSVPSCYAGVMLVMVADHWVKGTVDQRRELPGAPGGPTSPISPTPLSPFSPRGPCDPTDREPDRLVLAHKDTVTVTDCATL